MRILNGCRPSRFRSGGLDKSLLASTCAARTIGFVFAMLLIEISHKFLQVIQKVSGIKKEGRRNNYSGAGYFIGQIICIATDPHSNCVTDSAEQNNQTNNPQAEWFAPSDLVELHVAIKEKGCNYQQRSAGADDCSRISRKQIKCGSNEIDNGGGDEVGKHVDSNVSHEALDR
jgi:hypothetical protein